MEKLDLSNKRRPFAIENPNHRPSQPWSRVGSFNRRAKTNGVHGVSMSMSVFQKWYNQHMEIVE